MAALHELAQVALAQNRVGEVQPGEFDLARLLLELERFDGRTGLEILCAESDPEVFSFEVDTYWIQHGGANPVTWLERLRDRMHIVHFKDLAMAGSKQLFAEVGVGNLEWGPIIAACKGAGIEWYLIEQDVCQRDPFDSLALSLENLKGLGLD